MFSVSLVFRIDFAFFYLMSSFFQEMEEFTLFDGLVPSSGVDCGLGVEDVFDTGLVIPGDSLVKDDIGSGLFEELTESFEGEN